MRNLWKNGGVLHQRMIYLDMSTSCLLSSDSIQHALPVTNTQEHVQHQHSTRLSSRSPQPRKFAIRLLQYLRLRPKHIFLVFSTRTRAGKALIQRLHRFRVSSVLSLMPVLCTVSFQEQA